MRTKKLFGAVIVASAILFAACGKDHKDPTAKERIQQKWTFDKSYSHEIYLGSEYRDTTIGVAGDYADFRTDNKLYSHIDGGYDTSIYTILSDTKMVIDGDTATIQTLNDSQFQLHGQSGDVATDFYEYTVYLKK